jgi:dipeptide/tripeptide permease
MASENGSNSSAHNGKAEITLFGHPVGLYVLFFTEMWERFSYYGMKALLIFYMVNYFKWTQENASTVYKWYTSLVYLTPLLGGYLADRYLGNKRAVIIGASLMAVGHFLMAFEAYSIFYAALIFLIFGNGFFKPNMSTQVGRLYPPSDDRRDGAYTIFYMGINLGAFLAPLVCGWLADHTMGGYHSGFTAAGIGMVCGLLIYVFGLRWVREIDQTAPQEVMATRHGVPEAVDKTMVSGHHPEAISEAQSEKTPSVSPRLYRLAPLCLIVAGIALLAAAALLGAARLGIWALDRAGFEAPLLQSMALNNWIASNNLVSLAIVGSCSLFGAWILAQVHNALRDRVLTIFILGIFVVFFWAAFEQAGNALNLWADKTTDRYLTTAPANPPALFPELKDKGTEQAESGRSVGFLERFWNLFYLKPSQEAPDAKTKKGGTRKVGEEQIDTWNPIPATWFQAINALAIFILAPVFATLWTMLARRGLNPSIPTKMAFGLVFMCLSMVIMVGSAQQENRPSQVGLAKLPARLGINEEHQLGEKKDGTLEPYHAGRLKYENGFLQMTGVLPDTEAYRMIRDTAPKPFQEAVQKLQKKTNQAQGETIHESVPLKEIPQRFDLQTYAGVSTTKVRYDAATHTLVASRRLSDRDVKAIEGAGGDPQFRDAVTKLFEASVAFRVSPWWLFWCYILATIGELCLSPVGLSMVSKLSPARFATMLMGLWLLVNFFANFVAGAFGEFWGKVAPANYFLIFVVALGGAAVVLFLLVRKLVSMMHGVN